MRKLQDHITIIKLLGVISTLVILLVPGQVVGQVAVVTHKSVSDGNLDIQQLADIYMLEESHWKDGSQIVPIDLKGNSEVKQVFYSHLGRPISEIKRMRLRLILAGEGTPPEVFATPEEVLRRVRNTPGAIGYIPKALMPADAGAVNIVAVISL